MREVLRRQLVRPHRPRWHTCDRFANVSADVGLTWKCRAGAHIGRSRAVWRLAMGVNIIPFLDAGVPVLATSGLGWDCCRPEAGSCAKMVMCSGARRRRLPTFMPSPRNLPSAVGQSSAACRRAESCRLAGHTLHMGNLCMCERSRKRTACAGDDGSR